MRVPTLGKRLACDDLTLAQSTSSQLNNVTQIEDPIMFKEVPVQVDLALRNAVSIFWPDV